MSDVDTVENTVDNTVPGLNGGRLRSGGKPGNKGGPGRPKDKVREACALAFEQRIPVLKKIADAKIPDVSVKDRLSAIDLLGKYAGLQKIETENHNTVLDDMMAEAAKFDGDVAE